MMYQKLNDDQKKLDNALDTATRVIILFLIAALTAIFLVAVFRGGNIDKQDSTGNQTRSEYRDTPKEIR